MSNRRVVDNKSLSQTDGLIEINGFSNAAPNTVPYKANDGTLRWKAPIDHNTLNQLLTEDDVKSALESKVGKFDISDWSTVQNIVRAGMAQSMFSLGDQFITHHSIYGDIIWDVIGFDIDTPSDSRYTHSMTLQTHDVVTEFCFDTRDAFWVATDDFTPGTDTIGFKWVDNEYYSFVLPNASTIITTGSYMRVDGVNTPTGIAIYRSTNSGSAIYITIKNITKSETTPVYKLEDYGEINHPKRNTNCSNNYRYSTVRQWLNSTADVDKWWSLNHTFDLPPSKQPIRDLPGFLNGFDSDFLSAIGLVDKISKRADIDNGGFEIVNDKMFLLSTDEVFGAVGNQYQYYQIFTSLSTESYSADTNRIKYLNGTAANWWLRTPATSTAHASHRVVDTGKIDTRWGDDMSSRLGVAPACCII